MRNVLAALFLFFAIAFAAPDFVVDFIEPLLEEPLQGNDTIAEGGLELVRRQQTGCASGYAACANLNAPGLCCRTNQVCSADQANHVACCPINAACTGTIAPVGGITASVASTTSNAFPSSTTSGPSIITSTASPSFVQTGGTGNVRSTVPNQFYPFVAIPTTYTNAAACSSAYSSCQSEATSCANALANGVQGVTISAPNGGATITAIASLGPQSASSICLSLSSQACSGLVVEACQTYGSGGGNTGGARNLCGNIYGVGAGVAVGIAGQLLR